MAKRKRLPRGNLVLCADHQWAPGSIICRHLVDGSATTWLRIQLGEGSDTWLCPACFEAEPGQVKHLLQTACMHCVRKLQERPGIEIVEAD